MGILASILIAGAIVALIVGGYLKYKGGRISKAPFVPTGQATDANAGPKGVISMQGTVEVTEPLMSPVTGTPCLFYKLEVIGTWKEGDTNKKKTYVEDKIGANFTLNDGSGPIAIDVSNGGGDFDLQKTFDETKKEGFLADIKSAVGKGEPMMFGQYGFQNPAMSKANRFQCIERVLPLPPSAFVLGKLENGAIGSAGMFGMVLSPKTRDELLGSSAKNAKMALIGGAAAGGLGMVLGVVSAIIG